MLWDLYQKHNLNIIVCSTKSRHLNIVTTKTSLICIGIALWDIGLYQTCTENHFHLLDIVPPSGIYRYKLITAHYWFDASERQLKYSYRQSWITRRFYNQRDSYHQTNPHTLQTRLINNRQKQIFVTQFVREYNDIT